MTLKRHAAYQGRLAQAAVARYGGRPDLLLQENPHRDVRKAAKPAT